MLLRFNFFQRSITTIVRSSPVRNFSELVFSQNKKEYLSILAGSNTTRWLWPYFPGKHSELERFPESTLMKLTFIFLPSTGNYCADRNSESIIKTLLKIHFSSDINSQPVKSISEEKLNNFIADASGASEKMRLINWASLENYLPFSLAYIETEITNKGMAELYLQVLSHAYKNGGYLKPRYKHWYWSRFIELKPVTQQYIVDLSHGAIHTTDGFDKNNEHTLSLGDFDNLPYDYQEMISMLFGSTWREYLRDNDVTFGPVEFLRLLDDGQISDTVIAQVLELDNAQPLTKESLFELYDQIKEKAAALNIACRF